MSRLMLVLCLVGSLFSQETTTFRVDVKLVTVIATVKDASGRPIGELERENFTILAGGVPQQISVFERQTDRPLSVILLFDSSLSVAKELKFEQDAALRFVRNLLRSGAHPLDRIAVHRFSSFVDEVLGFSNSLERLEKALYSIRPDSGTSMYDALYLAAHRLEKREGRKVTIIITDGGDTTSSTKFAEALEAVQLADAVVYSIIVVPVNSDAGRNLGGENALKTISKATGGIAFRQYSEKDLDQTFHQIERDLRVQYLLGFYPQGIAPGPDRFQRIALEVDRSGVRVLARSGFFMPADPDRAAPLSRPAVVNEGTPPRERRPPPAAPSKTKKKPDGVPGIVGQNPAIPLRSIH